MMHLFLRAFILEMSGAFFGAYATILPQYSFSLFIWVSPYQNGIFEKKITSYQGVTGEPRGGTNIGHVGLQKTGLGV